jgi:hypothetical protein
VSAADNGTFVNITLNAAALAAINAAAGGQLAIGGSLGIAAVPEPGTFAPIGLGLLGVAAFRRRRSA